MDNEISKVLDISRIVLEEAQVDEEKNVSRQRDKSLLDANTSQDHNLNRNGGEIMYVDYENEDQLGTMMALVDRDLSEPYSIFTYRYFLNSWPSLCLLAMDGDEMIGTIIGKSENESDGGYKGYIAMLAVEKSYRKRKIGLTLVNMVIERMRQQGCTEVVLETEVTNLAALRLYEKLGFARDERLKKYYLNGVDAFRLRLWFSNVAREEGS